MSRNGPGQCCGGDKNIFAFFEHWFYRHVPLLTSASLPSWWIPEQVLAEPESCQDGYLDMIWVTTYANAGVGTRTRTRTWEHNPFVSTEMSESNSGDTTEYPFNESITAYDDWVGDGDWIGDNPEFITDASNHIKVKHYMINRYDYSHKLVITTEITLSTASTYTGFLNRCDDLYDGVTFADLASDSTGAGGGNGWVGLKYDFDENGDIYSTAQDPQVDYEAFFSVQGPYFSGMKSIRLPDVTMYASGSMTINPRIQNPIDSEATYSLTDTGYPWACDGNWPAGQTPTETCSVLTAGSSIEIEADPYHFAYIQSGACPP